LPALALCGTWGCVGGRRLACDDGPFINYSAWEAAGAPGGFVWGTEWAEAYPAVQYIEQSDAAAAWTEQVGKPMHAIQIETNAYAIELVCHDLLVTDSPSVTRAPAN
jgi:hypothetical protein